MPTIDLDLIGSLRAALRSADYTYDGVAGALGAQAHAALARHETTPGMRATRGGSPLETLTRLWPLQATVPLAEVEAALPGLVDRLCAAGILERSVAEVAARIDIRPYATQTHGGQGEGWIASDLTPGLDGTPSTVGSRHVLGLSSAATSLAQITMRRPVGTALDLGTGCGVQALHLVEHSDRVVATDVNPRALWLTRLNAALNEVDIDVREGSIFEPVAGQRFDLIVTNPPFVISPGTGERLVYRDSGLPGDRVVQDIVRGAPEHLHEGGAIQILANWMILRDRPWQERLSEWIGDNEAWVVQREVADLPSYVELWLKDAGLHGASDYCERYDTWLQWLEEQGAEAVGFGWVNLRRPGSGRAHAGRRLEEWPYEIAMPLGDEVAARFDTAERLAGLDERGLIETRPRLRADVVQETHGPVGAEDPESIVLRQRTGMRRAKRVDTTVAAFAGAADGDLTTGQLLEAIAELLGSADPLGPLVAVREMVAEGFLELGLD